MPRPRNGLAGAVLVTLLVGCADTQKLTRYDGDAPRRLGAADSVYVAIPTDGSYEAITYTGSGALTAQVVQDRFARRLRRVRVGRVQETFEDALKRASADGFSVLVYPSILHWEDRATEWSGLPDNVAVKLDLVEVPSGRPVTSAMITGKSGWATLGGDHPQDLLPKPVEDFVATLF